MLGSGCGNLGRGAWSPRTVNWQPGSAVWTDGSADGAPGGFQAAVPRLEWRRVQVARGAAGTGHPGERTARRECILMQSGGLPLILLTFFLAFHALLIRLSLVRSVIHFPLLP